MNDDWIDGSNDVIESYTKKSHTGSALIIGARGKNSGYVAYVFKGLVQCPDEHFASLAEAQAWVENALGSPLLERSVGG